MILPEPIPEFYACVPGFSSTNEKTRPRLPSYRVPHQNATTAVVGTPQVHGFECGGGHATIATEAAAELWPSIGGLDVLLRFIKSVMAWLTRVVTQPREELNRWQKAARFAYDLFKYGAKQLKQDRAPQMAGALAFRTLFALLPCLIVAMVVVKSTRGMDGFLNLTNELFASVELDKIWIDNPPGENGSVERSMSLADWLQGLVKEAAEVNLSAVGWLGVALISYAALSLLMTIENGFNAIYRANQGRSWTRRIPLYWFVLTMSPVAIGIMLYVNSFVAQSIDSVQVGHTLLAILTATWNLFMGWLIMFSIYILMPNANVDFRPAAIGAFVSSVLIEVGKGSLGAYLDNAFTISQLYGSLGLIPLFMFWVYLMWLAILFGLEVSAILQALHGRDLESMEPKPNRSGLLDPTAIIPVMELVAERFSGGKTTSTRFVAEDCGLPEPIVDLMFRRLVDHQIVHPVDGDVSCVTLAMPPDKINADRLIQIGFQLADEPIGGRHSDFVESLRHAQQELARQATLANLMVVRG